MSLNRDANTWVPIQSMLKSPLAGVQEQQGSQESRMMRGFLKPLETPRNVWLITNSYGSILTVIDFFHIPF